MNTQAHNDPADTETNIAAPAAHEDTQNVGLLNLHGARKCGKWEELIQLLDEEGMAIYAVPETHLDGEDLPIHLQRR